jgi:glucuronate isomerase
MKQFMDKDFLLSTQTAQTLYHEYAENMPILDYHCHISPKEIFEDIKFENITKIWLGGDHYKWRQMRSNGVEEKYITGNATDREKFQKWAQTLEKAIGNPLYHWSHLELRRYFGYTGNLNGDTAQEVWEMCNERLNKADMSVRKIMERSGVTLICTTDDPVDDLRWHKAIAEDESFSIKVLPAWRPDRVISIEKEGYCDYIKLLGKVSGITIKGFADMKEALKRRLAFFQKMGCKISDHGLLYIPYSQTDASEADSILKRRMEGNSVSKLEEMKFKTACMLFLGEQYSRLGWVMQLHFGATRNNNFRMYQNLGADTGYDGIYNQIPITKLSAYLDTLNTERQLPKTILYSLNPVDNAALGALIGCFQDSTYVGKIQHGSAWWYNDNKMGIIQQLTSLANLGLLGNFVGMLTDSRSFLSYTRHEYFRRILCDLIGGWVENGEYPYNKEHLGRIVKDISYGNAVKYFGFQLEVE